MRLPYYGETFLESDTFPNSYAIFVRQIIPKGSRFACHPPCEKQASKTPKVWRA